MSWAAKMVCCKSDIYIVPAFEGMKAGLLADNSDDAARLEPSGDRSKEEVVQEAEVES